MKIAAIVPIYKQFPDKSELAVFENIISTISDSTIFCIAPQNLPLDAYPLENISVKLFESSYFQNIAGYNKLMLSNKFYKAFEEFDYILICQLDTWIFQNKITLWANSNFDYIGAPWLHTEWSKKVYYFLSTSDHWVYRWVFKYLFLLHGKKLSVGNGGLSLRKTSKFIFLTKLFEKSIQKWPFHEDIFWALLGTIFKPFFSSAPVKTAIAFSFEENPAKAFELNNHRLPFGCHAWEKDTSGFWNQYIPYLQSK